LKSAKLHKEQKKTLLSLKRHWDGLTLFINDPRIPLHNNRAERLLRNAVILRKNSFGSGAEWSGHFAAKLFSIFQTWLINGLDPEALLLDFFDESSKPGRAPPDPSDYLPWTMDAQRRLEFALPKSFQRPG
jgi:transposase